MRGLRGVKSRGDSFSGGGLDGAQDAQQVQPRDFLDVVAAVPAPEQFGQQVGKFGDILQPLHLPVKAVEVRTNAHMVHARDLHKMIHMVRHVREGGGRDGGLGAPPFAQQGIDAVGVVGEPRQQAAALGFGANNRSRWGVVT